MEPVLDAVGLGSLPKPVKIQPAPTRDTAADALAAAQAEQTKRRSWATDSSSPQLTQTGGVPNGAENIGSRQLQPAPIDQLVRNLRV
jgi:hypothetical protein